MSLTIEVLYPEVANLFGDTSNIDYLAKSLPEAVVRHTALNDTPLFVNQDPAMVYLGPMTENNQGLAASKLRPHAERLNELIEQGTVFLVTGNAMEIFGSHIENEDGSRVDGLGLFPTYAKRQMMRRYSSMVLGQFGQLPIVGYKSQFSHSYGDNSDQYFYKVVQGPGINPQSP